MVFDGRDSGVLPAWVRHVAGVEMVLLLNDLSLFVNCETVGNAQVDGWIYRANLDLGFGDYGRQRIIEVVIENRYLYLFQRRLKRLPPLGAPPCRLEAGLRRREREAHVRSPCHHKELPRSPSSSTLRKTLRQSPVDSPF